MAADKESGSRRRIGKRLRRFRQLHELSLEELAGRIGGDPKYLSKVEGAKENISVDTLDKIATVLSVDTWEFIQPAAAIEKGRRTYTITQAEVDKIDELGRALRQLAKRIRRANS